MHCNNVLVPEQYGFRKGMSTEDGSYKVTGNVSESINQKMHVGGIFCDLAKASDCVSHEILLSKLHFYGVHGKAAEWFRSYVEDRKQKVEIRSSRNTQNLCLCSYVELLGTLSSPMIISESKINKYASSG
jgi:hypothetical protein